jgi:hypothetical protein
MKVTDQDPVVLDIAGAEVSLSSAVITEMFLDRIRQSQPQLDPIPIGEALDTTLPPAIGQTWHGGIYAGIARGEDGHDDHYLIVLEQHSERLSWNTAMDWAASLKSCTLPTRRELALCYANVPEIFDTSAYYWSSTQYAGYGAYAWYQTFGSGDQDGHLKVIQLRARAVRRLAIK